MTADTALNVIFDREICTCSGVSNDLINVPEDILDF